MTHKPEPTNDPPRRALSRIVAKHGRGICDSPRRVEALLRDLCGGHRREINIIMGAHEERVAADLIAAGNSAPSDALLARLAARLRDNLAYTPEAARWGVETWAVALGVLSEADLQERARGRAAQTDRSTATPPVLVPPPPPAAPPAAPPAGGTQAPRPTPTPQRGPTYAPPPRPQKNSPPPPAFNPPARAPRPTPPPRPTPMPPAKVNPPAPPVHDFPHAPMPRGPRRGLKLRSCLIVFALIIAFIVAAFFAIPAVIVLLQEEQSRPSVNEPRIR